MQTPEIHHDHDIEIHERHTRMSLLPFAFVIALLAIAFICAFVTVYR